ncbi:MAG: hypothetical protein IH624_18265 [Phycisphaerae bacterium]|nr:hypothetical protein [Phycisphaerae bacterium]
MGKQVRIFAAIGVVVLAGAAAVGVYILGGEGVEDRPAAPVAVTVEAGPEPVEAVKTLDVAAPQEMSDAEYDAFMAWLEEEAAKEEAAEMLVEEAPEVAAVPVEEAPAMMMDAEQMSALFGRAAGGGEQPRWRRIWADLNLTAEEQGRLRQGFGMLMARWATMPPEAQAAERARMQEMRVRWEAMGDEERAETSQRLRDRFEDWRASGRVELPELTLD